MKVLIIGAGAVGQVYGRHLALGGADVSFYVKDKYVDYARKGFTFYTLSKKNARKNPIHWNDYKVLTQPIEVNEHKWDQVYLTMSSTALRGDWLDRLAPVLGDSAVVMLQPGAQDQAYLETKIPANRVVVGVITVISYYTDAMGEDVPESGVAYLFPPLARAPFSGAKATQVVAALNAGGISSKVTRDVGKESGVSNTPFSILFTMVDAGGWDLKKISQSRELLQLARRAGDQAARAMDREAGKHTKNPAKIPLLIFTPFGIKLLMKVAKIVLPFDVEKYLKVHFTKVGDQMRVGLETYASIAAKNGLPNDAILELRKRLD